MTRFFDLWHEERLDQSEELEFVIAADDPAATSIQADAEVRWSGRVFYVAELEDQRRGAEKTMRVNCAALWYRLLDPTYVGSFTATDVTPAAGLEAILAATDWTVGATTTDSVETFSIEEQDLTRLALIRKWAKITGRYVTWSTIDKAVHLVDQRGADLGLGFRYGYNLRNIRRRVSPPPVTVLFPYGAAGLGIAGVNGGVPYLEDFTYYTAQGLTLPEARARYTRSRVWSDSSFIRDADLYAAALPRLADLAQPLVSYDLEVVDLSEFRRSTQRVRVADRVHVSDPTIGIDDVTTTVVRRKRRPLEPWKDEIELAYLVNPAPDPSSSSSRDALGEEWQQFVSDNTADYELRSDGSYVTNRIGLRFGEHGEANFHLDLFATGVGAGTLTVEVLDAETSETQYRILEIPYTNGEVIHASLQWAEPVLSGLFDYRVRLVATNGCGPSATAGVDLVEGESRFWILARGAVQETPVAANTERFDFTGAVQTFTVPDNVTELTAELVGGGGGHASTAQRGGRASRILGTLSVVPGTVFDVYVGGRGRGNIGAPSGRAGGWPNGGDGGGVGGASDGGGGGGSSYFVTTGGALAAAELLAPGGGGAGHSANGGDGGITAASAGGDAGIGTGGAGATTAAPGAGGTGGTGGENGDVDGTGQGGDGNSGASPYAGGGGGGIHGGGGGGQTSGGGGGSGHFDGSEVFDLTLEDAYAASMLDNVTNTTWVPGNTAGWGQDGFVVFSWDDPLTT